jgi:radical SAM superfamily enzyme YgiQ (UPF0313 family)
MGRNEMEACKKLKILLTAINARYVHTNLAVRYLASSLDQTTNEVIVNEYTINQYPQEILQQLYEALPDVIGFSCYIWNVEIVLKIVSSLKKVLPETVIVLGGPEVSYDPDHLMRRYDCIDFVISGEGEHIFRNLTDHLEQNTDYTTIPGISYRIRGEVYTNEIKSIDGHMESIPSPYQPGQVLEHGRIYYYESTRGCPFHCQFCLSGNQNGVSEMPMGRVYEDLQLLIDQKVSQVKFVDRTFNSNPGRALKIWQFLKEQDNGTTNFHFEINATLLNDEAMAFLETVPKGLFQFEIGVQSTNEAALRAIQRNPDQKKEFLLIKKLMTFGTIHIHVDLIAGLPHEDYFSFRKSFNDVFELGANMLQLGFLKLLKGSGLRNDSQKYGYVFQDDPPYEVLENHMILYSEIRSLKQIEAMLELYWNSKKYRNTIEVILPLSNMDPFSFFDGLALLWKRMIPPLRNTGEEEQLRVLMAYLDELLPDRQMLTRDLLRFDYCKSDQNKQLPELLRMQTGNTMNEKLHEILHQEDFNQKYFPDMKTLPAKKKLPYVRILSVNDSLNLRENGELYCPDPCGPQLKQKWLLFVYPRKRSTHRNQTTVISVEEG